MHFIDLFCILPIIKQIFDRQKKIIRINNSLKLL
jgi:hypothetical protein